MTRSIPCVLLFFLCACAAGSGFPGAVVTDATEFKDAGPDRLKPGDALEISIWEGAEEKKNEARVSREGTIDLMFIEDIPVSGLTETELDDFLTEELAYYYVTPKVNVKIKELVYVLGEVGQPGVYDFQNGLNLIAVITSAGGPTRDAKMKNVLIIRNYVSAPQVVVSDLSRMLRKGDLSQNLMLHGGDIVFLPSKVIADVNYYLNEIKPIIDFVIFPTRLIP